MKKIILTDCDGVLVNWNDGFDKFMLEQGYPRIPWTDHEYSIAVRHGITHQQAQKFVAEFNESSRIANLGPFADSVEYVKKLADEGFRFIVVTSISDAPQANFYRTQNLISIFGDIFDEIVCLEMGISKAHELQRWAGTGYFWIEDHMRQAEAGYEVGLRTILINHPYNAHYGTDLFPKVSYKSPWQEIYAMVHNVYDN